MSDAGRRERVTLRVRTWEYMSAELPRLMPDGWDNRLATLAAIEAAVDGIVHIEPASVPVSAVEQFEAVVTVSEVEDDHVDIVGPVGDDENTGRSTDDDGATADEHDGTVETDEFDLDDALSNL